ncbi:hypothetical protein MGYG_07666 [Nannizzia gypsea CBS 118893]|uniref:Restriction endonuclease domain-containing protein n=1 Tax=Arthroderma gypseum (strain ATCC MYA-4604 / CBS 118893) TaxID=535722 RepID=E4V3T6_ARTGP|nr:hypothetical protein MGYG_07666 [Nannizzia gypsea CBS 118893]EFR04660.1 hypothetical protein MGYG_07666 [Nannizzia gypsea CBS 118893]
MPRLGGTSKPHCVAPSSSSLLIGLPEGTPQIKYTNMGKLGSCFLIVVGVPSTILQDYDTEYPNRGPLLSANIREGILILKTKAKAPHEILAHRLAFYLMIGISNMSLEDEIDGTGTARFTNRTGTFVKQPDASFTPDGREWPILVVETGLSEKGSKLAIDARRWLESEGSEPKVAITAYIDQTGPQITFDKWEHESEPQRVTHSSTLRGDIVEKVIVIRHNGITEVAGDMTIL